MDKAAIEHIVRTVAARMQASGGPACYGFEVPVEVSARHVHLSKEHALHLFAGALPEKDKGLSQPGQFAAKQRVRLIGPKGVIDGVAVLGPVRGETQAELSRTDARKLGVDAPLRLSGNLDRAALIHIQAGGAIVGVKAAIVAMRHLHLTPPDAQRMGLSDGQFVFARLSGERPLLLEDVAVRVSDQAATALHIDTDEANAAGIAKDAVCSIRLPHEPGTPPPRPTPVAQTYDGKLITESDALLMIQSGMREITLRRGQLITPSALDALRASAISLKREGIP